MIKFSQMNFLRVNWKVMVSLRFFFKRNIWRILLKFVPCFIEINPKKYLAATFRRNEKSSLLFSLCQARFSRAFPPPLSHVVCLLRTCTSRPRPLMPPSRSHRPTNIRIFGAFPHHFSDFRKKNLAALSSSL